MITADNSESTATVEKLTELPVGGAARDLQAEGVTTLSSFESEFSTPAKVAVGTNTNNIPGPGTGGNTTANNGGFWGSDKPNTPPEPEPVFTEEKKVETEAQAEGMALDTFLQIRNMLQSELAAFIAKSKHPENYLLTDDQLDLLAKVWHPYANVSGKIPDWLWLLAVEIMTTGRIFFTALNDRKQTLQNDAVIASGETITNAAKASASAIKPRTRFKIYEDGRYKADRYGKYVAVGDTAAEKVDLTNLEHVKEVIFNNSWETFQKAFNLPADYLARHGLNIEDLEGGKF